MEVNPWMIWGATIQAAIEVPARTSSAPVTTEEIDSQASRSLATARRSTKTGIKVAEATPPKTRSKTIFGTVLARLNASAKGVNPNTHARTSTRRRPVSREARVPLASDSTREPCVLMGEVAVAYGVARWSCSTRGPVRRQRGRSRDTPRATHPRIEPGLLRER